MITFCSFTLTIFTKHSSSWSKRGTLYKKVVNSTKMSPCFQTGNYELRFCTLPTRKIQPAKGGISLQNVL